MLTPSQASSRGYAERTRMGFLVLLYLVKHDAIRAEALPKGMWSLLSEVLSPFVHMKLGRKHNYYKSFSGEEVNILQSVYESGEKNADSLLKEIKAHGIRLLENGYIYIYPNDTLDGFYCKLSVSGVLALQAFKRI